MTGASRLTCCKPTATSQPEWSVPLQQTDLDNRFTFHPVKAGQGDTYASVRATAKVFAEYIDSVCPDSRELSLAVTHIEEAVFWANAAIARNS